MFSVDWVVEGAVWGEGYSVYENKFSSATAADAPKVFISNNKDTI
jgi:hypothetical protein